MPASPHCPSLCSQHQSLTSLLFFHFQPGLLQQRWFVHCCRRWCLDQLRGFVFQLQGLVELLGCLELFRCVSTKRLTKFATTMSLNIAS